MNAGLLLEHYERIADAPDAVARLRRFILDLAVRGKLVQQDPNDEPASKLMKRIAAEKDRLSKSGSLKRDKSEWEGLAKEPPYAIAQGWVWTRLQDVFEISRGGSPRPAGDPRYFGGPIPWITVREITKDGNKFLIQTDGGLTEEGAARSRFISPGDLLLTNSGATLGVPKISKIRACMNDGVAVLRLFHTAELNDFAYLYLHSQTEEFRSVNQGMGQPNLNTGIIAGWFFPLPPLAEQHRIVAKVDELMALCDRLEAARAERERTLDRLAAASLARLNAPDPESYRDDARFALDALPALTARPDQIKGLRQTILNLAVRGKLVPQDPNDEPASEFLKRIAREKARLENSGKLKRTKEVQPAVESDLPYSLPIGWVWARFAEVAAIQSNLVDPRGYRTYPHIAPDNIESGTGRLLPFDTIGNSGVFSSKHLFEAGCLLYSKIRPALSKVTLVDFIGLCSADMYPIRAFIDPVYLLKFMLAEVFVRQSVAEDNRVAMPKINQEALSKILVVVPPLAEQRRIVARVDELMALCDRLEASLAETDATRRRLLEALLAEALAPAESREVVAVG